MNRLGIICLCLIIVLYILIIRLVQKGKMSIKYSFIWTVPAFILLLFILIPGIMDFFKNLIGMQTASNMVFAMLIGFLIVISIALTVIVSKQNERIRVLTQEVSILKSEKDRK